LTCPNTDTDHSDQSEPVLFAPLFPEGRGLRAAWFGLTSIPGKLAERGSNAPDVPLARAKTLGFNKSS
jgi:hypothetical protein